MVAISFAVSNSPRFAAQGQALLFLKKESNQRPYSSSFIHTNSTAHCLESAHFLQTKVGLLWMRARACVCVLAFPSFVWLAVLFVHCVRAAVILEATSADLLPPPFVGFVFAQSVPPTHAKRPTFECLTTILYCFHSKHTHTHTHTHT